jgi:hypothetical protein
MTPPAATGSLLWSRAAVLSVVALAAGAGAHVLADGLLPGPTVLLALVLGGTLACAPLLRNPASTRRVMFLLVAGQSVVHMALAVTAGHRGDPVVQAVTRTPVVPTGSGSRSGSYFDVAYASRVGDHGGGLSVPAPLLHAFNDISAQPAMAAAHLLAAAVCGWWLARGERALWLLLELASRTWSELVAPALHRWATAARAAATAAMTVEIPALVVVVATPLPQSQVRSRSVSRRGPPPTE